MDREILMVIRICKITNPDGTEKLSFEVPKEEGSNELDCLAWYDRLEDLIASLEEDIYEKIIWKSF